MLGWFHSGLWPQRRHQLKAPSIANPKAPVYIQKKVRLGIQDFQMQRVIAATLPPAESFVALNANIFHCGASARNSLSWCLHARGFMLIG